MADIALVFHWSPEVMATMSVGEIIGWRDKAITRWNAMHAPPKRRGRT